VIVRDLDTGADLEMNTGDLLKTAVTCGAEDAVLFAGATADNLASTEIYSARSGTPAQALTQGDGFKVPLEIDASGRTLLFLVPRQGPFRMPSETVTGGGGAGGFNSAAMSFGIVTAARTSTIVNGIAPALSRDGRYLAWIERAGAANAGGEQRLVAASIDALEARTILHKGNERLDAPAIAADGGRVAFQMMSEDDWEIFIVDRGGEHETRVTREIQHDVLPEFLTNDRLLAAIGEPRHRRSYLYEPSSGAPGFSRTRLFHNNTVRTIAPEYAWVPSSDGSKVLIVAERDGDTVSPERGAYLMDLSAKVPLADLLHRVASHFKPERLLKE